MKAKLIRYILPVIFVILLQIPLILPFLHTGFFPTHDDVQVVRIFEMFQSLKYGGFPSRWSSGLLYGHGYPLYTFYSPFIYYLGSAFPFIGLSFLLSAKLVFVLAFFIGGIGFFFLLRLLFGTLPALLGSVAFSYAPYRAVDVYVRGSLAEFFAFQLFPWVLLFNILLLKKPKDTRFSIALTLSLAALLLTHNISAFIFGAFILIFNLLHIFKSKKVFLFGKLAISALLSVGLSSFFIFPLLFETKFVRLSKFLDFPYQKYFVTLKQLWDSPWGFGGFIEASPMSLEIGKSLLVLSFLAVILNVFIKNKYRHLIYFFAAVSVLAIYFETPYSAIFWEKISILHYFQFPWRLHILVTTVLSILVSSLIFLLIKKNLPKPIIILLTIGLSGLFIKENIGLFVPQKYTNLPAVSETTTWDDEYMPTWVEVKPKDYSSDKFTFSTKSTFNNIVWGYYKKHLDVESELGGVLTVSHVYYPGWIASIDGKKASISYKNPNGFMQIEVPSGSHQIRFDFQRTWWRTISELVSIVSLITVLYLTIRNLKAKAS